MKIISYFIIALLFCTITVCEANYTLEVKMSRSRELITVHSSQNFSYSSLGSSQELSLKLNADGTDFLNEEEYAKYTKILTIFDKFTQDLNRIAAESFQPGYRVSCKEEVYTADASWKPTGIEVSKSLPLRAGRFIHLNT